MRTTSKLAAAVAAGLASTGIGRGDVLHVDQNGGGHFLTVQEAVDVASAGDTILVEGGEPQPGFEVYGKGVSIVAYGAREDSVVFDSPVWCDIPAGQTLLLSGIQIRVPGGSAALLLLSSDGSIRVQHCSILGTTEASNLSDLAFVQTTMQADTPVHCIDERFTNGLHASNAHTALFECDVLGDGTCCNAVQPAFNGVYMSRGELFASGTHLEGRSDDLFCGCPWCGSDGGDALRLGESLPVLASLLDCSLVAAGGAPYGEEHGTSCFCCVLCRGEPGAQVDAPDGTVALVTTDQHRRFTCDTRVRSGEPVFVRFVGAPGDVCALRFGSEGAFEPVSTTEGVSLLAPGFQDVVVGVIPPEGALNTTWTAPTLDPGESARTVLLQSVFQAGSDVLLRSPAAVTVLGEGPCQVFDVPLQRYCEAVANSSGDAALMGMSGSVSIAANDLVLKAWRVPPQQSGIFIYSPDQASVPLGDGVLCLGSSTLGFVLRLPGGSSGTAGVITRAFDNTSPPDPAGLVTPGSTWNFSAWFRDVPAGGAGFNFADGLQATFCP